VADKGVSFGNYRAEGRDKLFSTMRPEEEGLQPVPVGAHYEWTETSMFGFNIPEHGIDCIIYYWHHPALKVTFGGLTIWRGRNGNQVSADYSDYRSVMPLPEDITDCTYANGVTVRMIEPLKSFQINFADPEYDVVLDLRLDAIMPPACRYNGGHITQAMRTRGTLRLQGNDYAIDGFHTRDRSWNEQRTEKLRSAPPLNWTVGVFDEDFAFHHCSFDSPRYHSGYAKHFPDVTNENNALWGYVWDKGDLLGVSHVDQLTHHHGGDGIAPTHIVTKLTASNGRVYEIIGRAVSTTPVQAWPNMAANFVLFEWTCEGRVGYGDVQQCILRNGYRYLEGR
jgi:hypothetical protein